MSKKAATVPKVSIITRTKNRPQFLRRAIDSVLAQTEGDFEHIILNDGGDQAAVDSMLSARADSRQVILHNKKSVGLAAALNQAIGSAKGEYVCIHDDDDAWHPDRLRIGLEQMLSRNAVASVVPMEIVVEDIDETGTIKEVERKPHPESWCGEVSLFKQAHKNYLSNGAIMYKRSVFEELKGYDETLPTAEDWDFGIRLMLRYNVEQVLSENALVYYHQRPSVKDIDAGNSVYAGVREQERAIMLLRNNYLRKDIQAGSLGIGYIMNHTEQELINIVRIEAHINHALEHAGERVSGNVREDIHHVLHGNSFYQKLKRKLSSLKER